MLINVASIMMEVQIAIRGDWPFLAPELILHIVTIVLMLTTAFVDPGVIPQRVPGYELD